MFTEDEKGDIAVKYFSELFKASPPQDPSELLEGMEPRITDRMNQNLTKPVSDAEIKRAVKAIKSDSSPGSDGMTGHFFQQYWAVIGHQVTQEVRDFFLIIFSYIVTSYNMEL